MIQSRKDNIIIVLIINAKISFSSGARHNKYVFSLLDEVLLGILASEEGYGNSMSNFIVIERIYNG